MLRSALPRWQAVAVAPVSLISAATPRYARHVPERTRLYALVQAHYQPRKRGPPAAAVAA